MRQQFGEHFAPNSGRIQGLPLLVQILPPNSGDDEKIKKVPHHNLVLPATETSDLPVTFSSKRPERFGPGRFLFAGGR